MAPCPLCGFSERADYLDRPGVVCVGCGSLERHRALARDLATYLEPHGERRCLEVGPRSARVFGGYLHGLGWRHDSVDKRSVREVGEPGAFDAFIDFDRDLGDLHGIDSGRYELIVLQHVLAEILDYRAALDELSRVLSGSGVALLDIPLAPSLAVSTPEPPDARYGNRWRFGDDLRDDLEARFGTVRSVEVADGNYVADVFVCGAT